MVSDYGFTVKNRNKKTSYCSEINSLLFPNGFMLYFDLVNLCLNTSVCSGYGTFWEVWESCRRDWEQPLLGLGSLKGI